MPSDDARTPGPGSTLPTGPQDAQRSADELPTGQSEESATREAAESAVGTDDRVPEKPTHLSGQAWRFTFKNAWRQFNVDQCTDLAAALTYYLVQAMFPALLALVSLLGLFGEGQRTTKAILDIIKRFAPGDTATQLQPIIENMVNAKGTGFALVIGILASTWSASGFVGAFGRALNRIYAVPEGRTTIRLRASNFLLTVVLELMAAGVLLGLALSGSVAHAVFTRLGVGGTIQTVYDWLKWPVILAVVVAMLALLYNMSPNLKQAKFRWLSIGAGVAVLVWIIASLAFGLYVSHFGNYNKTYGTLGGVIAMLLWLWITNIALLLGAEVDSEIVRARQLQAGIPAERDLVIPLKDDRGAIKNEKKQAEAEAEGRAIRLESRLGATRPKGNGTPKKGTELDADGFVVEKDAD